MSDDGLWDTPVGYRLVVLTVDFCDSCNDNCIAINKWKTCGHCVKNAINWFYGA